MEDTHFQALPEDMQAKLDAGLNALKQHKVPIQLVALHPGKHHLPAGYETKVAAMYKIEGLRKDMTLVQGILNLMAKKK